MRTADSVSPSLAGTDVLISLVCYGIVYLIVFPIGVAVMARLVRTGPIAPGTESLPVEGGRPELPVTALPTGEPELLP
jgi:cytochrome d ubiquinol oxidase subunit I